MTMLPLWASHLDPRKPPRGATATDRLLVPQAVHKAELKMDEKGMEGAAGSGAQTLPMETPQRIKIDSPFLVMIYEKSLPSMIFLARINDPTGK